MARLNRENRRILLETNEGFSTRTYYEGKNSREERIYTISDGQLIIRAIGKSSWADSNYDDEWVASDDEVHRFLYNNLSELDTSAIEWEVFVYQSL